MKFRRILSVFLLTFLLLTLTAPTAAALDPIKVNADAAILVDTADDTILFGKNETKKMYPASITKVMTCLLALEAVERGELAMDQVITASKTAYEGLDPYGSTAGIEAGEKMKLKDLLYCMMLVSANEACNIVAEAVDGNVPAFVARMNSRAQELGMVNTHYVTTSGLHDDQHYTTCWDLYLLIREAMKNKDFMTICNTLSYDVPATNKNGSRELHTTNSLISNWRILGYVYDGAEGIKTGTTDEAGHCLASSAVRDDRRLVCIVLGCDGSGTKIRTYTDSAKLYDYGFDNFSTQTILTTDELIAEVPVELSKETNYVVVHPATEAASILPNDVDVTTLQRDVKLYQDVAFAPIAKGDVLGEITLRYEDRVCATVPLLAQYDVNASQFLTVKYQIIQFFSQTYVKIALVALVLLVLAVVIWWKFFRRNRRYGGSRGGHRGHRRSYRGRRR